jgi:hypothetical protein
MRRHFRHGVVKYIIKTGELRGFRKDRLRGSDEGQRMRDMKRRKVGGGAKRFQKL